LPEYERGAQKEALRWKRKKERERRPVRAEYKKTAGGRAGKILGRDAGGKGYGSFVSMGACTSRGWFECARSFEQHRVIEMEPMERHIARTLH
jgi:hypothetical protein